ncbi:MAG: peptidase T [Planctomycetaceae bacterium]|nr:peptidase T [Planctomycetaceae bacterium]
MTGSTALERFLRYVRIETTSRPDCDGVPSTECQFDLAKLLVEELKALGLTDAGVDEHCYVMATLPANFEKNDKNNVPIIGWIAHLDTSPDVSGKNVNPQIIQYTSGPIVLSNGLVIEEDDALQQCHGHQIVTTDGTTLLGADDKAGIAAIMTALERLIAEKLPHGMIRVCFTPDEEVGNGTKFLNLEKFGTHFAFTLDGELPGELNKETFTAKGATLKVTGREIHPGTAKGVMINAVRVAAEFVAKTPKTQAPETTECYEPYIHPYSFEGHVGEATVRMLLRSFNDEDMQKLENTLAEIENDVQNQFPNAKIELTIVEQYRNMYEKLTDHPEMLAQLEEAARRSGVTPYWKPIRGGTDGSRLTEMGLPTPNIYTGGHNFHSRAEWLSVNDLEKTVETLVQLAQLYVE